MIDGSSKRRMDLGRDPSGQIREFKDLQAGDGWPHWPGKKTFFRGIKGEVKLQVGWMAESLMLRSTALVWRFQDESCHLS